jgi:Protein of unknown function (DUF3137)
LQNLADFRIFYNQSIYPELLNLERRRRRLLWLFLGTIVLLLAISIVHFWLNELLFSLLLLIPTVVYLVWIYGQVDIYKKEFKPRIIGLVLDFIDNDINFGTLKYEENAGISPDLFFKSHLFACNPVEYVSEDYITGVIREMPFEMCELNVLEQSATRSRLDTVFRGVFLTGEYNFLMRGKILLLPDSQRQFSLRTAKQFTRRGGRRREKNLLPEFEDVFDTYSTDDANLMKTLSPDMQRAILNYQTRTKKDIYVSLIENRLFVAVSQPKDLLEPVLFRNVVSFDLVLEFFEDIHLLFTIVEDVDALN